MHRGHAHIPRRTDPVPSLGSTPSPKHRHTRSMAAPHLARTALGVAVPLQSLWRVSFLGSCQALAQKCFGKASHPSLFICAPPRAPSPQPRRPHRARALPPYPSHPSRAPHLRVVPSSLHMHGSSSVSCIGVSCLMSVQECSLCQRVLPTGADPTPSAAGLHHGPHRRCQQPPPRASGGTRLGAGPAFWVRERVWARRRHVGGREGLAQEVLVILVRPNL